MASLRRPDFRGNAPSDYTTVAASSSRQRTANPVVLSVIGLLVAACTGDDASSTGGGGAGGGSGSDCGVEGVLEACYPGPPTARGVGACQDGSWSCQGGHWSECEGAVLPVTERCDDLLDNDCNGVSDEGCVCTTGATRPCYSGPAATRGIGACTDGEQSCEEELWGAACVGQVLPLPEDPCNTIDDDCNGVVEDGTGTPQCCVPSCEGTTCGAADGCGSTCQQGSGCCTPACANRLCGEPNGCGGTCAPGSGCCAPSCAGASCGDSDGCDDWCTGSCPSMHFCNGALECECGPAPTYQLSGGNCVPSCGRLLDMLQLPNNDGGCCPTPCQAGTFGGGPGSTHDCTYCCASPEAGVSTCT